VDVQEGLLKFDMWTNSWVLFRKCYFYWINSSLPDGSFCSRHPKDPFGNTGESLGHALDNFSIWQLSYLFQFVLDSAETHEIYNIDYVLGG
jgi:hypothetical protein